MTIFVPDRDKLYNMLISCTNFYCTSKFVIIRLSPYDGGSRKPAKLTTKDIVKKGSLIGVIVTGPSLLVFFLAWVVLDDLMIGAIAGVIAHFIAMGFSLKISRRLLVGRDSPDGQNDT